MKFKIALLATAAVAVIVGSFLDNPTLFGVCYLHETPNGSFCAAPFAQVATWTVPFSLAFLLASVFAFFTTRKTFRRWAWFTLWYGLVAGVLMIVAAVAGIDDGGFVSIPLFDIEEVAQWLASIYAIISVLLMGISDFLVRRRK